MAIPKEWEFVVKDSIRCAIIAKQKDHAKDLEAEKAGNAFFETLLQQTRSKNKQQLLQFEKNCGIITWWNHIWPY